MSNNIWSYEWTGERTGWGYKLEFIPPSETALSNPTTIKLPAGSVEVSKMGMKYDKYPLGCGEAPALDLKIYLNDIPDTIDYSEFKQVAIKPGLTLQPGGGWNHDLQAGLIVKLYVKFNKNSDPDPAINIWRLQFLGICKEEVVTKINLSEMVAELQFQDLYKIVLQSFYFDIAFTDYLPLGVTPVDVTEIVEAEVVDDWYIKHNWGDSIFKMIPVINIENFIKHQANLISARLLRLADYTFTIECNLIPRCYKQLLDGSGGRGEAVSPYFIGYVNKDDAWAGLGREEDENSLQARYKGKSIWDYLSEASESVIRKAFYSAEMIKFYTPYYYSEIFALSLNDFNSATLKISTDIIKQVKASFAESYSDSDFSDLDSWEEAEARGQNEGGYDLTCVWNNMPVCLKYDHDVNSFFRTSGLYYIDTYAGGNNARRIHEYVSFLTGNGEPSLSDNLPGCSPIYERWDNLPDNKPSEKIAKNQSVSNIGRWSAATLKALFGNKEQAKLEIEVDYDLGVWFAGGGARGFIWWKLDTALQIDFGNIPITGLSDKLWTVISTELDFNNETAKVELITINI